MYCAEVPSGIDYRSNSAGNRLAINAFDVGGGLLSDADSNVPGSSLTPALAIDIVVACGEIDAPLGRPARDCLSRLCCERALGLTGVGSRHL